MAMNLMCNNHLNKKFAIGASTFQLFRIIFNIEYAKKEHPKNPIR